MLELENITVLEYINLEDKSDYNFAMKHAKKHYNDAKNVFNINPLDSHSFGLVKDMQKDFNDNLSWYNLIRYIGKLLDKPMEEVVQFTLLDFCRFKMFVIGQLKEIIEIESKLLAHTPTDEELEAGIETFGKFGAFIQLRKLAKEDVTKLEDVRNMKYSTCLMELIYQKEVYDFQTSLNFIRKPK
jgi:hypothetical protein